MVVHLCDSDGSNGRIWVRDSSVSDYDVEVGDIVSGLKKLDRSRSVGVGGTIDFDDEEFAPRADREVVKIFRGGRFRVADCGDEDVVGSGEVGCEKTFTKA